MGNDGAERESYNADADAQPHMLIAEDEATAASQLEQYFHHRKYRVTLAADGAEALERFEKDPAQVVVTDYKMPRMTGLELIERLREITSDLPIIVVTALQEPELLERLTEDSRIRVVPKPISLRDLEAAISELGVQI